MNGFLKKAGQAICCAGALVVVVGCDYRSHNYCNDLVDPCYPDRYMCAARRNVNEAFAPQVHNGHVLDQTIWNHHFEAGKPVLTNGGKLHLDYLARRRPCPDPAVYVQTAQDVTPEPEKVAEFPKVRADLDAARVQAVEAYLAAIGGPRGLSFQVAVHDPSDPSVSGVAAGLSAVIMQGSATGTVFGMGGGAGGVAVGGAAVGGGAASQGASGGRGAVGASSAAPPSGGSAGGGGY